VTDAPSLPDPRTVRLPDRGHGPIGLSILEAGEGPAVVLCHGFPELAYSWRHQLPALAGAGFHAIAPDQRGYGGSSAPEPIEAYDIDALCGDLDALCGELGIDEAVFVGHDWGGALVWAMPTLFPERVAGIVGVCTPFVAFPSTAALENLVEGDRERMYMLWFQEPGVAEAELDPRADVLFGKMMIGGVDPAETAARMLRDGKLDMNPFRDLDGLDPVGEPCVSPEEMAVYVETFRRTGFRGGINWYRNLDRNRELHPDLCSADPGVPCLMITAEWDPALPPWMAAGMPDQIQDLEMHMIPKAGHWVQQEHPERVNAVLVDWLTRRFR
jgi:pimeloyl-ACP methyl ester carboxylesterase